MLRHMDKSHSPVILTDNQAPWRSLLPGKALLLHLWFLLCALAFSWPSLAQPIANLSPSTPESPTMSSTPSHDMQLWVFTAPDCSVCLRFKQDIAGHWQARIALQEHPSLQPPAGLTLSKPIQATPTIVLFRDGQEISRFTGYGGEKERFWQWLGFQLLTPEQQRIAFEQGTERPFTGSLLDEKRSGTFVDPITGAPLFRSDSKFNSGTGWPSFFSPLPGAVTLHPDNSHGMQRIEVRSASSGIHLGHVFNDGPPPTGQRYCINSQVLTFIPDTEQP